MKKLLFFICLFFYLFKVNAAITGYKYMTDAGAGSKDGSSWSSAFDESTFETWVEGNDVTGYVLFVLDGNYSFTSSIDFNARDASAVSPFLILGVKGSTTNEGSNVLYSDWSNRWYIDSTTMPHFNMSENGFRTGDYCKIYNIQFTTANSPGIYPGSRFTLYNCCVKGNYGSSSSRNIISTGEVESNLIGCYFTSSNTKGIAVADGSYITKCIFKGFSDATNGIALVAGSRSFVSKNIFKNCTIAASISTLNGMRFENNTFFACGTDISATTAYNFVAIDNIHDSTKTDGYKWTTQTDINTIIGTHGDNSRCTDIFDLVDTATIHKPFYITTGNPLFINPINDSLQLHSSTPCTLSIIPR